MIFLFLACTTTITGVVQDQAGVPLPGASLEAEGCSAVSGPDGRFAVRCEPGSYTFAVSHPGHLPHSVRVNADRRGGIPVPTINLVSVPTDPGIYVEEETGFLPLPSSPFRREDSPTGESPATSRYCPTGSPTSVRANARWLDVHGVEWRIFRVGEDDCFYRLRELRKDVWTRDADEVTLSSNEAFSATDAQRRWIQPGLSPGRYVIAERLGDTFVPATVADNSYRGWYLEVR
ncbi:MAG TPA: carboxypeptidase-like regulatory domain-containing protein [Myxococcota bacterium]|nr:carboxypeptidase-like regulatory domain-containing protein [Myxococcota bacterium]